MMPSETKDYISLSYQEEALLLQAKWLRSVSSEEYRSGIEQMKLLILEKGAALLLIDSRRLRNVPFADQQWIKREVAPELISSRLQKLARVLTEDVFNYISFENLLQNITDEHKTGIEIAQFTTMESALAWLKMD